MTSYLSLFYFTATCLSALAFVVVYLTIVKKSLHILNARAVVIFFCIWSALLLIEFVIFGPYSFVEMTADGLPFYNYLVSNSTGKAISHLHDGGQDIYAIHVGTQYIQLEKLFLTLFPTWIGFALHKIMVTALGFWGSFLLIRLFVPGSRQIAVGLSAIFTVSHLYLANYSFAFGTGFAVIPFATYVCIAKINKQYFWLVLAFCTFLVSSANIIKIFPALLVSIIGACIIYRKVRLKQAITVFIVFASVSALNWSEVLYALAKISPLTTRGMDAGNYTANFIDAFEQSILAATHQNVGFSLFIVSLITLFVVKDPRFKRSAICIGWIIVSITLAKTFPWQLFGLSLLSKLEHNYMAMSIEALALPISAYALSGKGNWQVQISGRKLTLVPYAAIIATSFFILTWDKVWNGAQFLWFGGQAHYSTYEELNNPKWKTGDDFRVVTLFDSPNPNILSGFYGYETFDGQTNISLSIWSEYWRAILRGQDESRNMTRIRHNLQFWDGKTYDIDARVDIDMLGIANVRYLFSPLPLKSNKLHLRYAPAGDKIPYASPKDFSSLLFFLNFRLRRIFDAGELYIYEIEKFLPRVFQSTKKEIFENSLTSLQSHKIIKNNALNGRVVVNESIANHLPYMSSLDILGYRKLDDGYSVDVIAPDGGILVINSIYTPFWKAWSGDQLLDIIPVNGVHMAVSVPNGTQTVKFRYNRLLLRERITKFIKAKIAALWPYKTLILKQNPI